MAGLLDAQLLSSDVWAFDMKMHYVELAQESLSTIEHMNTTCGRPWGTALIHRRPWTHLGYNEGSSITAYSTYEYHLKQSPKMLYLTLIRLAKEAQPCCNIRSFSFVGVFPFSTNIAAVVRALQKIRTLKEVRFQISPGPENNVLGSQKRMGRAQAPDLWLEWNGSYKAIVAFLGTYEFAEGSRFISRDCTNLIMGKEVEEFMDLLQTRGLGWRRERDAVWIRDRTLDRDVATSGDPPAEV
jgi:hypothetical protein